jgi:hypothetical protein
VSAPRRRRRRDPYPIASLVGRWQRAASKGGTVDLVAAWHELGQDGAGAIPTRVSRNGVLTVACTDAARAQHLAASADDLLDRLRHLTGASLTRLDTVIADHALVMPNPYQAPPTPPPITDATRQAAEEAAAGMSSEITDPDIRDVVARAAAEAIARSWDRKERG